MKYKGYTGIVEFDEEAKLFHGEVLGLRDVITFQGTSVGELETAMAEFVPALSFTAGLPSPPPAWGFH